MEGTPNQFHGQPGRESGKVFITWRQKGYHSAMHFKLMSPEDCWPAIHPKAAFGDVSIFCSVSSFSFIGHSTLQESKILMSTELPLKSALKHPSWKCSMLCSILLLVYTFLSFLSQPSHPNSLGPLSSLPTHLKTADSDTLMLNVRTGDDFRVRFVPHSLFSLTLERETSLLDWIYGMNGDLYNQERRLCSSPLHLTHRGYVATPKWMPEAMDSTEPYIYFIFPIYTYLW